MTAHLHPQTCKRETSVAHRRELTSEMHKVVDYTLWDLGQEVALAHLLRGIKMRYSIIA